MDIMNILLKIINEINQQNMLTYPKLYTPEMSIPRCLNNF